MNTAKKSVRDTSAAQNRRVRYAIVGLGYISFYQIIGTDGTLRVDPAYEYADDLKHHLALKGKTRERVFRKRDQFAPELIYFSDLRAHWEGP